MLNAVSTYSPVLIFTFTTRTIPCYEWWTSIIRASDHLNLGKISALKSSIFTGSIYVWFILHLRLDCNIERYLIILLSESWFDIARTYLHLLRLDMSPSHSSITNPPLHLPSRRCIDVSGSRSSFSILYFTSIFTVYNSSTLQNNILVKIDGVVYSYRVEIKNSYKYYTRNKLSLIY